MKRTRIAAVVGLFLGLSLINVSPIWAQMVFDDGTGTGGESSSPAQGTTGIDPTEGAWQEEHTLPDAEPPSEQYLVDEFRAELRQPANATSLHSPLSGHCKGRSCSFEVDSGADALATCRELVRQAGAVQSLRINGKAFTNLNACNGGNAQQAATPGENATSVNKPIHQEALSAGERLRQRNTGQSLLGKTIMPGQGPKLQSKLQNKTISPMTGTKPAGPTVTPPNPVPVLPEGLFPIRAKLKSKSKMKQPLLLGGATWSCKNRSCTTRGNYQLLSVDVCHALGMSVSSRLKSLVAGKGKQRRSLSKSKLKECNRRIAAKQAPESTLTPVAAGQGKQRASSQIGLLPGDESPPTIREGQVFGRVRPANEQIMEDSAKPAATQTKAGNQSGIGGLALADDADSSIPVSAGGETNTIDTGDFQSDALYPGKSLNSENGASDSAKSDQDPGKPVTKPATRKSRSNKPLYNKNNKPLDFNSHSGSCNVDVDCQSEEASERRHRYWGRCVDGQCTQNWYTESDPSSAPCLSNLQCSNYGYEGYCDRGECRSFRRDACRTNGAKKICTHPLNGKVGVSTCWNNSGWDKPHWGDCSIEDKKNFQEPKTDYSQHAKAFNDILNKMDYQDVFLKDYDLATRPCNNRNDCSNVNYEGICAKGRCVTYVRPTCTAKGEIRSCIDRLTGQTGVQMCAPKGLGWMAWGDCISPDRLRGDLPKSAKSNSNKQGSASDYEKRKSSYHRFLSSMAYEDRTGADLNTDRGSCTARLNCSNRNYEGRCFSGVCKSFPRENCNKKGRVRYCYDKYNFQRGIQICGPKNINWLYWGDCFSFSELKRHLP